MPSPQLKHTPAPPPPADPYYTYAYNSYSHAASHEAQARLGFAMYTRMAWNSSSGMKDTSSHLPYKQPPWL